MEGTEKGEEGRGSRYHVFYALFSYLFFVLKVIMKVSLLTSVRSLPLESPAS